MTPRLVVTGFSSFPGVPVNPTERLIGGLDTAALSRRLGVALRAEVLPVSYADVAGLLPHLLPHSGAVAAVHFGVAARSRMVRIERLARNAMAPGKPDAAGEKPERAEIEPGGPALRRATFPVASLHAALRAAGVPVRLSDDAGRYLCNYLSYKMFGLCAGAPVGFVHLPLPAELDAPRAPHGRPTWQVLAQAVETVVTTMAETLREPQKKA